MERTREWQVDSATDANPFEPTEPFVIFVIYKTLMCRRRKIYFLGNSVCAPPLPFPITHPAHPPPKTVFVFSSFSRVNHFSQNAKFKINYPKFHESISWLIRKTFARSIPATQQHIRFAQMGKTTRHEKSRQTKINIMQIAMSRNVDGLFDFSFGRIFIIVGPACVCRHKTLQ